MCGRNNPSLKSPDEVAAQRAKAARLQHPQQHRLQGKRQFTDLVQKKRPATGRFKVTYTGMDGTGERTSAMTE
ncbi:hypothetical protein TOC8171_08910 [Pseudomonas syringae]